MKEFIQGIFKDHKGHFSSKRFVGILSALSLNVAAFIWHTDTLFNILMVIVLGALGITGAEKIMDKSNNDDKPKIL